MTVASKPRVLIADDNKDFAVTLASLLDLAGYDAVTEFNGPAALSTARELEPNACVLDINMPGLDGCEVAKAIRSELDESVRLVAITGMSRGDYEEKCRDAGFDVMFTKPADVGQVLASLKTDLG